MKSSLDKLINMDIESPVIYQFTQYNNGLCGLTGQVEHYAREGNIPAGITEGEESKICPILKEALVKGVVKFAFGKPYTTCPLCHSSKSVIPINGGLDKAS